MQLLCTRLDIFNTRGFINWSRNTRPKVSPAGIFRSTISSTQYLYIREVVFELFEFFQNSRKTTDNI